ncbi:uncharacterized protein LOC144134589 [Amblyomma americanum]
MEGRPLFSNDDTSAPLSLQEVESAEKAHEHSGIYSRPQTVKHASPCSPLEKQPATKRRSAMRRRKPVHREERSHSKKINAGKRSKPPNVLKDCKRHKKSRENKSAASLPPGTGPAATSHAAADDHTSLRDGALAPGSQEYAVKLSAQARNDRPLFDAPEASKDQYVARDTSKHHAGFRNDDTHVSFSQKTKKRKADTECDLGPASPTQAVQRSSAIGTAVSSRQLPPVEGDPQLMFHLPGRPGIAEANTGARPCPTDSLESEEPSTKQATRARRLASAFSPVLSPVLSSTARELGTSLLRSNPLVSLMRRASRVTWTASTGESRLSHSSREPDDNEHGRATRHRKTSLLARSTTPTYDPAQMGWFTRGGACIPVLLAALLATAFTLLGALFFLLASKRGHSRVSGALLAHRPSRFQLEQLCSTKACLLAVDSLVDAMVDRDGDACAEFSQHVCGGWRKDNPNRSSFEEEVLERSYERLHEAMMESRGANKRHASTTQEASMAALYRYRTGSSAVHGALCSVLFSVCMLNKGKLPQR